MKKIAKDINVLTDAQVDEMLLLLEAAWAQTGNKTIFRILEIFLNRHNLKPNDQIHSHTNH